MTHHDINTQFFRYGIVLFAVAIILRNFWTPRKPH